MKRDFRAGFVTNRYWSNALVILALLAIPTFRVIKFDFANLEFYILGSSASVITTASVFLSFWAGSYVATLLADYFYGRLFCGWICSWGTLLRTLSYTKDKTKRKKLPSYAPQFVTFAAATLSTLGLMNWFVDLEVMVRPQHVAFVWVTSAFILIDGLSIIMLWKVGLNFCQTSCPIGWYLTTVSQKHVMRIDFKLDDCTHGDVCVKECPMGMDPRLLATDTDTDSHALCILCGDCLSACNACAAKVEGEKPLTYSISTMPLLPIITAEDFQKRKSEKRKPRQVGKPTIVPRPVEKVQ